MDTTRGTTGDLWRGVKEGKKRTFALSWRTKENHSKKFDWTKCSQDDKKCWWVSSDETWGAQLKSYFKHGQRFDSCVRWKKWRKCKLILSSVPKIQVTDSVMQVCFKFSLNKSGYRLARNKANYAIKIALAKLNERTICIAKQRTTKTLENCNPNHNRVFLYRATRNALRDLHESILQNHTGFRYVSRAALAQVVERKTLQFTMQKRSSLPKRYILRLGHTCLNGPAKQSVGQQHQNLVQSCFSITIWIWQLYLQK